MKSIVKIMIIAFVAVLASCSDADRTIYDGSSSNQTLLQFGQTTYDFGIPKDGTTTLDVEVLSSTKAPSDRTYDIEVVQNPDSTTADPNTYTVPSTVTIPAGEYIGHLMVEGVDNGVETSPVETITLNLTNPNANDNTVLEDNSTVLSQFQVCPVPDTFLIGDYMIEDVTSTLGPNNGTTNFASEVVSISEGDTPTQRVFSNQPLPIVGAPAVEFTLNLVCNKFKLQTVEINIQCSAGISYGPAPDGQNSTYDENNEQDSYIINYTEDSTNDCGNKGVASFKLTKVN